MFLPAYIVKKKRKHYMQSPIYNKFQLKSSHHVFYTTFQKKKEKRKKNWHYTNNYLTNLYNAGNNMHSIFNVDVFFLSFNKYPIR